MKIDIIVVFSRRYEFGHEKDFVPPITGIHLAAITPANHEIRVFHQQVDIINLDTDSDLIALSFFSGFALEAYRLAKEFKKRNKTVIAVGPHVTFCEDEALQYFDSIVIGEVESIWQKILDDFEKGKLESKYQGVSSDLHDIPTPRYDLLTDRFFIKKVIQATRGCPYSCSFCSVPIINPSFRKRPVNDVIRDIKFDLFKHWWQKKIIWFWDDNLTIDRNYIKQLLTQMKKLKKWWLTQASIDIVKDDELLGLMRDSGCIGIFLGLETFGEDSLTDANKRQNRISEYKLAIKKLHKKGICVMAGLISGFDHDTYESIIKIADDIMKIGVDVPFLSIMTPFLGTNIYAKLKNENRILHDRNWNYYNGYNVTFQPQNLSPEELLTAHRKLWSKSFCLKNSVIRILRSMFYLRWGAFLMTLFMNSFYGFKRLRKNYPIDMGKRK
jgi:radical SAM superfamily enzyme YgiQ (UPF0313 family)